MKITQHRPAYFTGYENEVSKFGSLNDLLEIPWIKRIEENPELNFYRWSQTDNLLIAEFNKGKTWFVIGRHMEETYKLRLPKWKPPKEEKVLIPKIKEKDFDPIKA
tara:strand:- start:4297 stop:4614 length:318 start_codon:yes stop_codon:yes gene_type:complete